MGERIQYLACRWSLGKRGTLSDGREDSASETVLYIEKLLAMHETEESVYRDRTLYEGRCGTLSGCCYMSLVHRGEMCVGCCYMSLVHRGGDVELLV
jgi:hypothetical protein